MHDHPNPEEDKEIPVVQQPPPISSLTKYQLETPASAGKIFRMILSNGADRARALELVQEQPLLALMALAGGDDELGLTPKGGADVFEDVLEGLHAQTGSPPIRELIAQHLSSDRLIELLTARGDLPAAAILVVGKDEVLAAVAHDVDFSKIERLDTLTLIILRGWAIKLKEREDYEDILGTFIGPHTLKQYLLVALWVEAGCPEEDLDDVTPDLLDQVGLDADDRMLLSGLLASGNLTPVDPDELQEARIELQTRRQNLATTPAIAEEKAREDAETTAGKLDI